MNDQKVHAPSSILDDSESRSGHDNLDALGARLLEDYEAGIGHAREQFDRHPAVVRLFRSSMEPVAMEAFLISFAILGVRMTEPVEGWIRRAGLRCGELSLTQLGKALESHAKQEADHHLMMLADARRLVTRWNQTRSPQLNLSLLLDMPPAPGVMAYRGLHEDVISGPSPYGQLGIEYEIEMLSVTYGPQLIARCTELLGGAVLEGLSFLRDHAALDVSHTNFNRLQLSRLLAERPGFLPGLLDAGSAALHAYAMFLDDCLGFVGGGCGHMTGQATAREVAAFYEWGIVAPSAGIAENLIILAELSEFRGRILYANGRRPQFWRPGRGYADDDPLDLNAFHITVRAEGELVGCTRIRPLPEQGQTLIGELVTGSQFAALLEEFGLARNDCLDAGRWIVAPSARGTAVGRTLILSSWAVGIWLGKRRLIVAVGTRDGQVNMLTRFGGQVLPSIEAKFFTEYDDELSPMYFDLDHPPPRVSSQLGSVRRLLKLPETSSGGD